MDYMINDIARLNLEIARLEIEREAQMRYYEIRLDNLKSQLVNLKTKIREQSDQETGEEFPPILGIS